jgi:hypothetical protein
MNHREPQDTTPGLLMEQACWSKRIEQSLESVAQDRQDADHAQRPETHEGWLLIERALRRGADALQALARPHR